MSVNFAPAPADARALRPAPLTDEVSDRRRPRLLLSAARHGLSLYRRDRDLQRLLTSAESRMPPLDALFTAEARCEAARRNGAATYSFARHIEVLIALLAELRLTLAA